MALPANAFPPRVERTSSGHPSAPQVYPEMPLVLNEPRIFAIDKTMLVANNAWLGSEGENAIRSGSTVRFITNVESDGYTRDFVQNQLMDYQTAHRGYFEFRVYCTRYMLVKIDPNAMADLDRLQPGAAAEFLQGIKDSAEDRRVELSMGYLFPLMQGSIHPNNMGATAGGGLANLGTPAAPLLLDNNPVNNIFPIVLLLHKLKMVLRYADPQNGWIPGNMFIILPMYAELLLDSMGPRVLQAQLYTDFPYLVQPVPYFCGFNIILDTDNILMITQTPRVHQVIAGNPAATLFACSPVNGIYFPNVNPQLTHDSWRSMIYFGGKVGKPEWLASAFVELTTI